jgi:hypothetical protein
VDQQGGLATSRLVTGFKRAEYLRDLGIDLLGVRQTVPRPSQIDPERSLPSAIPLPQRGHSTFEMARGFIRRLA